MGTEIRRVPANWEHPKQPCPHHRMCGEAKAHSGMCYKPLYDKDFETAAREWLDECIAWDNGTHKEFERHPEYKVEMPYYWQYAGDPPDPDYYRPKFTEEPTWYQVYQTVSEGTPVTPPFATKEELVDYLVTYGDFWDQIDGRGGWSRDAAERFVRAEWAVGIVKGEVKIDE